MKKLLLIMLMSLICASVWACGDDKDVSGELSIQSENDGNEQVEDNVDVDLLVGKAEGDTYENKFLGLGFTLPEGWTFYTQEQMDELNNITEDMLDEEMAKQIQEADLIYDMYALDSYGNSVNINLEKIGTIAAVSLDVGENLDTIMPEVENAFKQTGATGIEITRTQVDLSGNKEEALKIKFVMNEVEFHERVISIKAGKYLATVTVATAFEDATDAVLTYFYRTE